VGFYFIFFLLNFILINDSCTSVAQTSQQSDSDLGNVLHNIMVCLFPIVKNMLHPVPYPFLAACPSSWAISYLRIYLEEEKSSLVWHKKYLSYCTVPEVTYFPSSLSQIHETFLLTHIFKLKKDRN
jgi:hypothetical protein